MRQHVLKVREQLIGPPEQPYFRGAGGSELLTARSLFVRVTDKQDTCARATFGCGYTQIPQHT